jgi:Protein of unknown function (DUF3037)
MITIDYKTLRYLPDRVSGEFVNLGVVAYENTTGTLRSEFVPKCEKIACLFPDVDRDFLEKAVEAIQTHLNGLSDGMILGNKPSLESITSMVLPVDYSSLVFSETQRTLDTSVQSAAFYLCSRFVMRRSYK